MQIEDVTGICLTSWRSSQKQGHLAISHGLLGQIVVDDKSVLAVVSEVLSNSAAGVRSQELQRCGLRCSGSDNDGERKGSVFTEGLHDVSDCGPLLADSNVDAVETFANISTLVEVLLLVEDSVNGNSRFTGLPISDDQFSLSTSNRYL